MNTIRAYIFGGLAVGGLLAHLSGVWASDRLGEQGGSDCPLPCSAVQSERVQKEGGTGSTVTAPTGVVASTGVRGL